MWILLFSLLGLVIIALIAGYIRNQKLRKQLERGEIDRMPEIEEIDAECCGQYEVCEKESLLAAVSQGIVYYDDEELDRFIGREERTYTEKETEQFRDVLYTMPEEEVAGWVRSLQLRGIALPYTIKNEVLLIVGERRQ
ncbi:MAG: phospholipase [Bacteroidia bacterium]|nr:phospholipase [Bacteroidia bacterium]